MADHWQLWLQKRFGDRPALPRAQARATLWQHLPTRAVEECFAFFEEEYGIDPGLLRPTDPLTLFTEPVQTRNPLRWMAVEPRLEDRASELNYRIVQQAAKHGKLDEWLPVDSLDDYFRVWAGMAPAHLKGSAR